IEKVMRRKSGRKISEPVPGIYTKKVFNEVTGVGMIPLVKQFADDEWVWGTGAVSAASWPRLMAQVTDLYERDYSSTRLNSSHQIISYAVFCLKKKKKKK